MIDKEGFFQGKKYNKDMIPNFNLLKGLWEKYIDVYLGGINVKKPKYLPKAETETKKEYSQRFENSFFPGKSRKVINTYDKYIWKELPIRVGLESYLDIIRFWQAEDEVDINTQQREYTKKLSIYGVMYRLIDHDDIPDGIILNDWLRKTENIKYNIYEITPDMVTNYSPFRAIVNTNENGNDYVEINLDGIAVFEKGKLKEKKEIKFPTLPIYRDIIDEDNDKLGESLIRDISDVDLQLYQLLSSLNEDFKKQTYSPFLHPVSAELMQFFEKWYGVEDRNVNGNPEKRVNFEIQNIMPVPASGYTGQFLTKDTKYIDQKLNYIKYLEQLVDKLGSIRNEEIRSQSGIAKYLDMEDANISLFLLSNKYKEVEEKFWRKWFMLSQNREIPDNISIEYNTDFNIRDREENIKNYNYYLERFSSVSPTATKRVFNNYINEILEISSIENDKINEEIEEYLNKNKWLPSDEDIDSSEKLESEINAEISQQSINNEINKAEVLQQ